MLIPTILVPIECLEVLFLSPSETKREEPHEQQKQDSSRLIQVEQQSGKSDKREQISRVADAAVHTSSHQTGLLGGFKLDACKRIESEPNHNEQKA